MAIFRELFVDDLAICFCGRSLDTIERHLQQSENAIQEWATRNGFRFAAHKCKVVHFTAPRHKATRPPTITMGDTLLPVEESTKILGLWWDSHLSFKKHSVLKTQCKEALNLIRVVAHLKWGGERDTLLMLYRTIVRSKLDMDVLCMAQHQEPICDNWTASKMLDWDWHLEHCHQPSLQHVHGGQRNSFGGKAVEAVHALLSEDSCLHWQPSTSCPTWIWPNHKRSVSF